MPSRKRSLDAIEQTCTEQHNATLSRLRNMWQFANLVQWIYIFGKVAKISDAIDVEEIETQCLTPNSTLFADIALSMMRIITNHRGLTHDMLDGQIQKHFLEKAPERNPFGDDEELKKFKDFDIFTKIITLQQLTKWTMIHPERIREKMDEQKDSEQTGWRIEPYGWDSEDRTYFVLDDNRIYRLTEPPEAPPPRPKKKKTYRGGKRSSKRRRTDNSAVDVQEDTAEQADDDEPTGPKQPEDDGLGGMKWECIAITLDEVQQIIDGFRKTDDDNEKILCKQLQKHLLPLLEAQEASRKRKAEKRERELANLAKMATAKRSSRLAGKMEQQRQEEEAKREIEQRQEAELVSRREEQARIKREKERDLRMASRGQRLQDREARRVRHEEDLAQLSEDSKRTDEGLSGRSSGRHLKVEIEKKRKALKELEDEEDDWIFDCSCGLYGQVDDGAHSVACEKCNVWQHSKCLGISEGDADRPDFQFVCQACQRHEEEAARKAQITEDQDVEMTLTEDQAEPAAAPTKEESTATNTPTKPIANISPNISFAPPAQLPPSQAPHKSQQQQPQQPQSQAQPQSLPSQSLNQTPKPSKDNGNNTKNTITGSPFSGSPFAGTLTPRSNPSMGVFFHGQAQQPTTTSSISTPRPSSGPNNISRTPASAARHLDPAPPEAALSTPTIIREIYRAGHVENGNIPSSGGESPVKHSPHSSFVSTSFDSSNIPTASAAGRKSLPATNTTTTTVILPPRVTLSPAPRKEILTPPVKHQEPVRPTEWR